MELTILHIIVIAMALVIPPMAVLFRVGFREDVLINIVFSILGFIPGVVHALYIVLKHPR
ncbi:hypothetical protein BDF22DRAFT_695852 [Syncephalis plumigaleata]|nr:hypothetical protein BDF22DRAFT_695852 [Syncephalis plumigaleata]